VILGDSIVVEAVMQLDRKVQAVKSKEGKYLTFSFLGKDRGLELEVIGWTQLLPQPARPDYIKGVISPWGSEIPVIDLRLLYGKGTTALTDTTCIVIFEHDEPYRYYFGMVVEELSNVVNIADGGTERISQLLLSAKRYFSVSPALEN
jgi:chemotaxis signal transduction protein